MTADEQFVLAVKEAIGDNPGFSDSNVANLFHIRELTVRQIRSQMAQESANGEAA